MLRSDRRALVAFLALTFALSWGVWGTTLAFQNGLLGWRLPGDPLSFIAVTMAALTVTALSAGRSGIRNLFRRMILWRVHVKWYIAALLIPGVPAVVALAIHFTRGGSHEMGALVAPSAIIPLLLTQVLLHLLTEELGWRGFALPRLRARFGPLAASTVLGLIWGAWHIPMFFVTGTRQTYPFVGFVILIVSISVIMTWIFDRTRGSILIAALFHAAMNTWWAATNVLWGDGQLFWIFVVATAATAGTIAILQRGQDAPLSPRTTTATVAV